MEAGVAALNAANPGERGCPKRLRLTPALLLDAKQDADDRVTVVVDEAA
jgi:hypothetical protein